MRASFRAKLLGLVGIMAAAFVAILVMSNALSARAERQLVFIQQRFVPKIGLEPELQGRLERLGRGFQDAVAAHDLDALDATRAEKDGLLARLDAAREATDPADAAALRAAIDDYCNKADGVSRRMIAGETGEPVLDAITAMQASQAWAGIVVKRTAALDRDAMQAAFATSVEAEATARVYRTWVSVSCLGLAILFALGVSRGLVRSVRSLGDGLARFGRGDFEEPIGVSSRDELGELARHANAMAASLRRHDEERRRIQGELEASNKELEAFSYSVAHDLRAPLRGINGYSRALVEDYGPKLDGEAHDYLARIDAATQRMGELIDALLSLARVTRADFRRETVNLSRIAELVVKQLRAGSPDRTVDVVVDEGVIAQGDAPLLRALLENLLGNAWKFTSARPAAHIRFGVDRARDPPAYFVRDDGAGFDMAYATKLFAPFQRLHSQKEFAGTGVGLATVQRIVHRHGGRIWAEGAVGEGATFHFTLTGDDQGAPP